MNGRQILKENRRSLNLPILKWLHLHSNPFLVGLRRVSCLEDLGRSSIIEENTEQCVFKFLRFCVMTFIENVSLNEPQPLRLVFTRCGSSRAAFRALPPKTKIACHIHLTFSIVILESMANSSPKPTKNLWPATTELKQDLMGTDNETEDNY